MKTLILGLLGVLALSTLTAQKGWAVKTAIEASGNVQMNGTLKSYQDNVLQSITNECLAQKAAKNTVVSLTVDPHGNIMRVVLSQSGLSSEAIVNLITALKGLKLGSAGDAQSDTLRITMDFDLAEVLAGAKSTGTSISIKGGSITGDGTATGGIRIGGGGTISAGGGNISLHGQVMPSDIIARQHEAEKTAALNKLADLEKSPDSNPQDLCNARLVAMQQYWRDGDLVKARDLLGQALKYLDGPAGPFNHRSSRDLDRVAQLLLASQTPADEDLVWRIYSVIERKTQGGCSDYDLNKLATVRPGSGSAKSGDQVISVLSRLLELREMREGRSSLKLIPILTTLATANESQNRHDAAVLAQEKIAHIQKQNGLEVPVSSVNQNAQPPLKY
jgi:hypothetical protein